MMNALKLAVCLVVAAACAVAQAGERKARGCCQEPRPNGSADVRGEAGCEESAQRTFNICPPVDEESVYIGHSVATDTIHDWIARDPQKKVVCGTLDHAGFFHSFQVAEFDWDLYVKPDEHYKCYANDTNAEHCESDESQTCISGEVTAPGSLRTANPWFDWNRQTSTLVRERICVFGPWVSDDAHGSRPEIHPVNALWWEEPPTTDSVARDGARRDAFCDACCGKHPPRKAGGIRKRTLIVLQDASGRFQRSEAFRSNGNGLQDALDQLRKGEAFEERGQRAPWIPTQDEYQIAFDAPGDYGVVIAHGKTLKEKTVRTARFRVRVDKDKQVQDVTVEEGRVQTTGRQHARDELQFRVGDVEFGPREGTLRLRTKWKAPACDYCGQERFVVVSVCPGAEKCHGLDRPSRTGGRVRY